MIFLIFTDYHYYLIRLITIQLLNFFDSVRIFANPEKISSLKISTDYFVKDKSSQLTSVRHHTLTRFVMIRSISNYGIYWRVAVVEQYWTSTTCSM